MGAAFEVLGGIGSPTNLAVTAAGTTGAIGSAMASLKTFTKIPEGYVGVRTRFGKASKHNGDLFRTLEPGLHAMFPWADSITPVSVQDNPADLEDILINDDKKKQIIIKSSILWAVIAEDPNPQRAFFRVEGAEEGLAQLVTNHCVKSLRKVTDGKPIDFIKDEGAVKKDVIGMSQERLSNWGVVLRDLQTKTASESLGEMVRQGGQGGLGGIAVASNFEIPETEPVEASANGANLHLAT